MSDVPRETAPPAPDVARGVFGSRLPLAVAYADLLADDEAYRRVVTRELDEEEVVR